MNNQDYNEHILYSLLRTNKEIYSHFGKSIYSKIIIEKSLDILRNKTSQLEINKKIIKNKTVFIPKHREAYSILFRKTIFNLYSSTKISTTSSRDLIIKRLIFFLQEGIPYEIYRLDLKSFYESFDIDFILSKINEINNLSPISKEFIKDILMVCNNGIPRGLSISSVLSDFLMTEFDNTIKNHRNIFFYSRFIDDIIIISSPNTDIKELILDNIKTIPNIKLNHKKYKKISINGLQNKSGEFDYLGYNFSLEKNKEKTPKVEIKIKISKNKINKIKTRIIKSIIYYIKSPRDKYNEELLIDRLKFLSGSYVIYDNKHNKNRIAGIRNNYKHINDQSSLKELDQFIKSILYSKNSRLGRIIRGSLKKNIRQRILSISFYNFCEKNIFFNFNLDRLSEIKECWKHE